MILNVKELYLYVKRGDFMIGIIGAMEEEVKALLDKTEDIHENKILDCVFYEGKIDNKQVVILQGGIGKVNSAICVTLLLTNYDIEYVINIDVTNKLILTLCINVINKNINISSAEKT